MPEKLMSCVEQVMSQGKSRSEAFAICQKSTGQKPHKKSSAKVTHDKHDRPTEDLPLREHEEWDPPHASIVTVEHEKGGGTEVEDPKLKKKMKEKMEEARKTRKELQKKRKASWDDQLPGGLADKKKPEDFDAGELKRGVEVELEHVDDRELATEIAMDHLMEDPKYYTKLKKVEGYSIYGIVTLADRLDELKLTTEAVALDELLQKEAQWKWFKEKGQQLKDWFQTEREVDPKKRQVLTDIRQTHWDLINKINKAYQLLDNAGKSMHNPETYVRDLNQALDVLQRDLGSALQASQQQAEQAAKFAPPTAPAPGEQLKTTQPTASPSVQPQVEQFQKVKQQYPGAQQIHYPGQQRKPSPEETPTEKIIPKKQQSTINLFVKLADALDRQGKQEIADRIDKVLKEAQLGWVKEKGTQLGDAFRSKVGLIDEEVRQQHYTIMERLKGLYNHLQGLRQSVTSPDYPQQFQKAVQNAQEEFNALMTEAKRIQQQLGSQQPTEETPAAETPVGTPTEEPQGEAGTRQLPKVTIDYLRKALTGLTQEQHNEVLNLIRKLKGEPQGQGV